MFKILISSVLTLGMSPLFAGTKQLADCPATSKLNPTKLYIKSSFFGPFELVSECLLLDKNKFCPEFSIKSSREFLWQTSFSSSVSGELFVADSEYFITRIDVDIEDDIMDMHLLAFRTGQTGWKQSSHLDFENCTLRD